MNNLLNHFFIENWTLFRIQFSIIRDQWVWVFLMASMFPLSTLLFLKFFTVNPTPEIMLQIITGNMLFGLIIMGLNFVAQEISFQKHQGHFTFYASLPISKINFMIANLMRGIMTSLPSLLILAAIGQWVYDIQFHYSWGLIPVVMLSVLSVVGFGVLLGFWSPNHQLTNMVAQALMMVISFLTPIMVSIEQLPLFLQWFSYIFPTTYAAEAFRSVLSVGWTQDVTFNMLVLFGFSLFSFWLIMKKMSWRVDS
jgi:ABC-2 type transport system permease protein